MRLTLIETKTKIRPPDAKNNDQGVWRTTFTIDQGHPMDVGYLLDANGIILLPKGEGGRRVFVHWSNVRFTTIEDGPAESSEDAKGALLKAEQGRVVREQAKRPVEPGGKS